MLSLPHSILLALAAASLALGQNPAAPEFNAAYRALAGKDYDSAIAHFRAGLKEQPGNTAAHKDLGYTLLKTGDSLAARDEFETALHLNGNDEQAALEYGFLAFETGKVADARRTFEALRKSGSTATRTTAGQSLQNIEAAVAAGAVPRELKGAKSESAAPPKTQTPAHSGNLWAFFDSAYRSRADVNYLAQRWSDAGISVLYVASWHNLEPDAARDEYLKALLDACHQRAILVYAWLELPYVSEKFWQDHASWRDKTALGRDAQIGWRKLMNLQNPDCSRAAALLVTDLLKRFDWDGVNLAELSFEPQTGSPDPAVFTPMNDNVRAEFKEIAGFDPKLLFDPGSPHSGSSKDRGTFLDFRGVLASRMQSEWLKNLEAVRKTKPYLDLVLTQRDEHAELVIRTPAHAIVGVDLSAVDLNRANLLASIEKAARENLAVAIYSENAIDPVDLPLIGAAAAATVQVKQSAPGNMEVVSDEATRIDWPGPAAIDGQPWPIRSGSYLMVPAGHHVIAAQPSAPPLTLTAFNAGIQSATVSKAEVDIAYQSRARAPVSFDANVAAIEVDGAPFWKAAENSCSGWTMLPAGQHLAAFIRR